MYPSGLHLLGQRFSSIRLGNAEFGHFSFQIQVR